MRAHKAIFFFQHLLNNSLPLLPRRDSSLLTEQAKGFCKYPGGIVVASQDPSHIPYYFHVLDGRVCHSLPSKHLRGLKWRSNEVQCARSSRTQCYLLPYRESTEVNAALWPLSFLYKHTREILSQKRPPAHPDFDPACSMKQIAQK